MTDNIADLAALLEQAAAALRQRERAGDALDDLREGGLLTVQQAATICGTSGQTIRDWIDDSARRGPRVIGEKRATWIISTPRLLAYIEKHRGGRPARVKAENLLKEYWPKWSRAQELGTDAKERAAG